MKQIKALVIALLATLVFSSLSFAQPYQVFHSASSNPQTTTLDMQIVNGGGPTPPLYNALDLLSLKWKIAKVDPQAGPIELDFTPIIYGFMGTPLINIWASQSWDQAQFIVNYDLSSWNHYWGSCLKQQYGGECSSNEVMIRNATCYPSTSCTAGRPWMPSWSTGHNQPNYSISALPLSLSQTTVLTRFAGVGGDNLGSPMQWQSYIWTLNIWEASGSSTAVQMYAGSPKSGNVVSELVLTETHQSFGNDYYVTWQPPTGVVLSAGSYLVAIRGYDRSSTAPWDFRETSINLGSDYLADTFMPGQAALFTTLLNRFPGSQALDIWGY